METDKAQGERVAGRIVYEAEAVGVLAVIFTVFAIALLVTGLSTVLGRAEAAPSTPSSSDVRPPLPPY